MEIIRAIAASCFWLSIAGVAYAYAGYPVLIWCLSRVFGRRSRPPAAVGGPIPRAALLIVAHNESSVIDERIRNALELTYPPDRLEIVVASDGSDDGTVEKCQEYGSRVRTLAFPRRRGKAATLNDAVAQLDAEIILLSDANTRMEPAAAMRLVRWFADQSVGVVCGRLLLTDARTGRNADGVYWRYETFLKECEGRLGGLLGANGAIYAVRRSQYCPLAPGTMTDDFVEPLMAVLRHGCRIVYDADALAHEETAPDLSGEFRRRSRIGVGGYQALGRLWPLLSPRYGWTAFTLWSHKVLRWMCPFLLVGALTSAAVLSNRPTYGAALAAQVLFYGVCAALTVAPGRPGVLRVLRVLPLFVGMNLALMVGFCRALRGRHTGVWRRTERGTATELPGTVLSAR